MLCMLYSVHLSLVFLLCSVLFVYLLIVGLVNGPDLAPHNVTRETGGTEEEGSS